MTTERITAAAKRAWLDSDSVESFPQWLAIMVGRGFYWGAI